MAGGIPGATEAVGQRRPQRSLYCRQISAADAAAVLAADADPSALLSTPCTAVCSLAATCCDIRRSHQAPDRQPAEATRRPLLPRPDDPACSCFHLICSQTEPNGFLCWQQKDALPPMYPYRAMLECLGRQPMRCAAPLQCSAGPGAEIQAASGAPSVGVHSWLALASGVLACPPCSQIRPYIILHVPKVDDVQPRYIAQHCQNPRSQVRSMTRLSPSTLRDAGLQICNGVDVQCCPLAAILE